MCRTMKRERCVSQNPGGCTQAEGWLTRNANHRYLSVMVTRLMISLKKAASSQGSPWSMGESAISRAPGRETYSMQFASNCGQSNRRDDDTLVSSVSPGV